MTDITIAPDISGSKGKWSPLTILCHRSEASWSILTRDVGREAQDMWSSPRLEPPSPPQLGPSNPAGKGRRSGSSDPVLFWKPLKERIRIFQKALLLIYGPAVGQNNQNHKNAPIQDRWLFLFLDDLTISFIRRCHFLADLFCQRLPSHWSKAGLLKDHPAVWLSPCRNGLIHRKMVVDCPIMITSTRPEMRWNNWPSQSFA